MGKKISVNFENVEYVWHNRSWSTPYNNMNISTSLAQKLNEFALKNNLLTREDFVGEKKSK